MKLQHILYLFPLALFSCSDDVPSATSVNVAVSVSMPEQLAGHNIDDAIVSFYNIATGNTISGPYTNGTTVISILPGLYNVSFSATATLDGGTPAIVRASKQSVTLTQSANVELNAYANVASSDLIFNEIFYTGTLQTSGNQYTGDQYFKLVNNTDKVVYADGLVLFESLFLTTQKYEYTPDIMNEAVSVDALYAIPGNGTDYPINPGEELLIADIAIDHRNINPNSFDLSHADFEWYDISTDPKYTDIDNPNVTNLDKWYCYTLSVWQLHNRGFKAYGLARIPQDKETYLAEHYYTCEYDNITAAGAFTTTKRGYWIPNEWIVDLVTLSVESEYQWNISIPQLDSGYTFCGTIEHDKTRYFHSVRRKLTSVDNGRNVFADTNNSSEDFNPFVTPYEIENQQSAIDLDGTKCTTATIDGVTSSDR